MLWRGRLGTTRHVMVRRGLARQARLGLAGRGTAGSGRADLVRLVRDRPALDGYREAMRVEARQERIWDDYQVRD